MIQARKTIKVLYSKCQHLTCLTHALHQGAEEIRGNFPEVNDFISNCKNIFLKLPYRIQCFRNILSGVPVRSYRQLTIIVKTTMILNQLFSN